VVKLPARTDTELSTMRHIFSRLAPASAAVALLAAGAASAQVPAPPSPPMEGMMAGAPGAGPMGFMPHHAPDPEKRAQHLRDVLQLRADQDGALKTYVDATTPKFEAGRKEQGPKDGGRPEPADRKPPTTLERLDHMSRMAEAMQKRIAATRAFYNALSPSQQKAFDALDLEVGEHVVIRRFETRGASAFHGDQKAAPQHKAG
jgi:Spy/CpxP family protein refolding chaperone